jgi:hypothetical protein
MEDVMPRQKQYEYVVEGVGSFPADMLRYDNAFPASEDDDKKVKAEDYSGLTWSRPRRYRVRIIGKYPPTVERWKSFGWKVVK